MRKPNLNLRAIAQAVGRDREISGVFLRTINSSYYGLQSKIDQVEQAIPLIGLQQTLNIVRAEALKRATGGDQLALAHSRLHERAETIARLCSIIATRYLPEYLSPDLAYLVGQFHDCGVPILMRHYPYYCAALNAPGDSKWPDTQSEDGHVGADHCDIGYRLAKDWKLSNTVCDAIRSHHAIEQADEDARGYVAALQMAMHLYNRMTRNDDAEWERTRDAVLQELEIAPQDLEEFEFSVRDTLRQRGE
jgi:HD-like signal output (HDOD) protein